jgi:hypothetical protein
MLLRTLGIVAVAIAGTADARPAAGPQSPALPQVNIDSICRTQSPYCVQQESNAKQRLVQIWAHLNDQKKIRCIRLAQEADGSYITTLACAEPTWRMAAAGGHNWN